jgi:hypothetical protein
MYMGGQTEMDCIPNPRAVAQFVSHFDQGRYPWLEHPTELTDNHVVREDVNLWAPEPWHSL